MVETKRADRCTSCGVRLVDKGGTSFLCPQCSQVMIGRCAQCKDQSTLFVCKECGFEGP